MFELFYYGYEEDFTSNGVAFEVIISPGRENARKPNVTPKKKENLSKEELDERMEAAKIRRNVRVP